MSDECCETCQFMLNSSLGGGWCRRYAPRPETVIVPAFDDGLDSHAYRVAQSEELLTRWPYVGIAQWCGEWEPRR